MQMQQYMILFFSDDVTATGWTGTNCKINQMDSGTLEKKIQYPELHQITQQERTTKFPGLLT